MTDIFYIILLSLAVCVIIYQAFKMRCLKNQQNSGFGHYRNQAQQLEEYKRFRHDYKNKLAGLKALLDNGEQTTRAAEYLSDLLGEADKLSANAGSYSDNTLIDAVLQELAARCEEANIKFDASVIVGNELPLSDVDTCAVFYNIVNNAFEAASKQYEGNKFINFVTTRRQKWLIVTAENSFDGNITTNDDGSFKTSKDNSNSHGYGIKNIKRMVESVPGASVKIETEGNLFRISLIFSR